MIPKTATGSRLGVQKNTEVLARAFGGEPLRRESRGVEGGAVRIAEPKTGKTALFPQVDVFEFDARLEKELRVAYEKHDQRRLAELWASASPFAS